MDKVFGDSIAQKDFVSIRDKLKNRLLMDHDVSGGLFYECWFECEKAGITSNIFQEHDGRELSDEITEDNYNALVGQLATNFSEARLRKILYLAKQIWPSEQTSKSKHQTFTSPFLSDSYAKTSGNEEVLNERILGEREIGSDTSANSFSRNSGSDSKVGVIVAVAAVTVGAIILGALLLR